MPTKPSFLKFVLSNKPWGILLFVGGFAVLGILGWIYAGAVIGLMGLACSALIILNVCQVDWPFYLKHLEHLDEMHRIAEEVRIRDEQRIINKLKGVK